MKESELNFRIKNIVGKDDFLTLNLEYIKYERNSILGKEKIIIPKNEIVALGYGMKWISIDVIIGR